MPYIVFKYNVLSQLHEQNKYITAENEVEEKEKRNRKQTGYKIVQRKAGIQIYKLDAELHDYRGSQRYIVLRLYI